MLRILSYNPEWCCILTCLSTIFACAVKTQPSIPQVRCSDMWVLYWCTVRNSLSHVSQDFLKSSSVSSSSVSSYSSSEYA